jgi:hypothetical protein
MTENAATAAIEALLTVRDSGVLDFDDYIVVLHTIGVLQNNEPLFDLLHLGA